MQPTAADGVAWSVSLCITTISSAKAAEPSVEPGYRLGWAQITILANVNSRLRLLYVIARPFVVCLYPTQAVEIFGIISTALGTLAIR